MVIELVMIIKSRTLEINMSRAMSQRNELENMKADHMLRHLKTIIWQTITQIIIRAK